MRSLPPPLALRLAISMAALSVMSACHERAETAPRAQRDLAPAEAPRAAERLRVEVVRRIPHDTSSFTQGLLIDGGRLFESTGLVGESRIREVVLDTGREIRRRVIPRPHFGEGLAKVGDELIMLTWKTGKALRFDAETFTPRGEHEYEGEGWGLTFDGRRLVMSDGSASLQLRDAETFALLGRVDVTLEGRPVRMLNELEYVDGLVYANVWQTDRIVAIDPSTGEVRRVISADGLLTSGERRAADVLNGIAHDARTGALYVTGKLWPWLFEVRLVPSR